MLKPPKLKPCVVFDLDGTLADTSGDLLEAANVCFRGLGLGNQLEHGRDSGTALRGGKAMLRLGFERAGWGDEAEIERQYPALLAAYDKNIDNTTVFYPGAMESVRDLKAAGFAVSICTNKPTDLALKLLGNLGVLDEFDAMIGATSLPTRKPDAAPFWAAVDQAGGDREACLLVGDTLTDRKTSTAANVPSVLVTFGPGGGDMVALKPDALLDDFKDMVTVAQALISTAATAQKAR